MMQRLDGQMLLPLPTEPEPAPALGAKYAALLEDLRRKRRRPRRPPRKNYLVELRDPPGGGGVAEGVTHDNPA